MIACGASRSVLSSSPPRSAPLPGRFEPAEARAGPDLLVGVDDDTLKWAWPGWRFIAAYEDLGFSAIRVTLRWRPGQASLDHLERLYLDRVTTALMRGNRVVLSIYGSAASGARDAGGTRRVLRVRRRRATPRARPFATS